MWIEEQILEISRLNGIRISPVHLCVDINVTALGAIDHSEDIVLLADSHLNITVPKLSEVYMTQALVIDELEILSQSEADVFSQILVKSPNETCLFGDYIGLG